MRRQTLLVCVFALLSAPRLGAQQILPGHFGAWTAASPSVITSPKDASWPSEVKKIDGQLLAESGITRVEERGYKRGNQNFDVRVYQLRDPSSAYEVHTNRLEANMQPAHLGQASAANKDHLEILVGNLAIEGSSPEGVSRDDLRALVEVLQTKADPAPLPAIPAFLPEEGRIPGTERYALGPAGFRAALGALGRANFSLLKDVAGFDSDAEAMFARYRRGREEGVLLLLIYPNQEIAGRFQKHIEEALGNSSGSGAPEIRHTGSLLSIVLPPASPAYAAELLKGVRYETVVTENEPSTSLTDKPFPVLIVNAILGTGVFMVAAVAFGIAFGGVRVFTKMLLPGKVFDRPQEMDILQLGIGSKPIESGDFYKDSRL